ncbi:hypothetical protein AALC25_14465 [Lachnospiraceae bacterium 29-84]
MKEDVDISDKMKEKKSRIVKFVRKVTENPNKKPHEIQIKEWIRLNDGIFT